jgi:poly(3-hydroxybutyrate) depolymerase
MAEQNDLRALIARPGANDAQFIDPGFPDRPVMLRSARPKVWDADTPVLFVHHGVQRNGGDYRDFWLPLVDEAGILVVAPEFSHANFPGSHWYNYGNIVSREGRQNPRAQWTYGIEETVYGVLQAQGLAARPRYGAFGHSAGAQFVHRMVSLGFRDRLCVAVSANAGSYAMPTLDVEFPFGLGGTGLDEAALRALLGFRLTVMAGTDDVDNTNENFPKEKQAMAQGDTRYARAHAYVAMARAQAERLGARCTWTIIDVPGVGHDGRRMSAAAAPVVAAALHAA